MICFLIHDYYKQPSNAAKLNIESDNCQIIFCKKKDAVEQVDDILLGGTMCKAYIIRNFLNNEIKKLKKLKKIFSFKPFNNLV